MSDLRLGDCLELMGALAPASVDAVVTDPPYHLTTGKKGGSGDASVNPRSPAGRSMVTTGFMGKKWDGGDVAFRPETWAAALRVTKPGAHLLAFGGTRTFHRLTCAIEDAGWEIRDCLSWLYGQGFPKSLNLEGEDGGKGTALKPGWEPIIMARKPLDGTVAANVAAHGTGALNIDASRIDGPMGNGVFGSSNENCQDGRAFNASPEGAGYRSRPKRVAKGQDTPGKNTYGSGGPGGGSRADGETTVGRWPANGAGTFKRHSAMGYKGNVALGAESRPAGEEQVSYGDFGGASRFFYCAKASRAEREEGLEGLAPTLTGRSGAAAAAAAGEAYDNGDGWFNRTVTVRNTHPTVKPVALMRWLCRLVTPPIGLILDPFMGSGTTGIACALEGFRFLGMEKEADFLEIARRRIAHAAAQPSLFDVDFRAGEVQA